MKTGPDSILDAAETLFGEFGVDGASTRMIAETAGVNIAMLSYYFGSKEGLFEAVVQRRCEFLERNLNQLIDLESLSLDALRRFLLVSARFLVHEHPAFLAVLVRESTTSVSGVRAVHLGRLTFPMRRTLDKLLEAGHGRVGRVRGDLCFALMLGIFAAGSVSPPFASPAKAPSVEWLADAVLRAVGADEASSVATEVESSEHVLRAEPVQSQPDPFEIGAID